MRFDVCERLIFTQISSGQNFSTIPYTNWICMRESSCAKGHLVDMRHLHISHNAPYFPPKEFRISIVFNFSWEGCNTQEKWKPEAMQNLGAGQGANKVHCYGRCASSEINRHSFSPPEPLVLIDHETKRNDGLCGREYLLFKPDGKVAGFLTLVSGKLRCVNFMTCPKGIRSMGSNNNLLNEYFRAKYIDTQKCFTFP